MNDLQDKEAWRRMATRARRLAFLAIIMAVLGILMQVVVLIIRFTTLDPAEPPKPPCATIDASLKLAKTRFESTHTIDGGRDLATVLAPWAAFCARDPTIERELLLLATPTLNEQPITTISTILERLRAVEKE